MDRRTLIIGGVAVAAIAAVGVYYNVRNKGSQTPGPGGETAERDTIPMEELLVAGPLGDMALGQDDAPVTIVEYASMTCGHCAAFHKDTLPTLKSEYINTGKARLIFREYPLDPVATAAFMVARCGAKETYFPLVDAMFQLQSTWIANDNPVQGLMRVAQQAGYSQESFNACLQNQSVLDGVNWVKERATKEFGISSTPTFFINGEIVRGNLPIEEFRQKIDGALAS
jgi:protein-disulfide isomerase